MRTFNKIPKEILDNQDLNDAIKLLPDNYNFEIHKTVWKIQQAQAERVLLQLPEGLLMFACVIADILERFANCEAIISTDVVYGACCVDDFAAKALNCSFLVHYGHSCLIPLSETTDAKVLYVFVDIKFSVAHLMEVVRKNFPAKSSLALFATVQFASSLQTLRDELRDEYSIFIPQAKPLSPGEALGCTAPTLPEEIDSILFLADGRFHLEAAMIANPKIRAFKYDPYSKVLTEEKYDHETMRNERLRAISQAKTCKSYGIILSTLGRQGNLSILNLMKEKLKEKYCQVYLFLLSEISPEKLDTFERIECWVQVGCPRLSIDWGGSFAKPLLTPYELCVATEAVDWQAVYPMDYYSYSSLGKWTNNNGKGPKQKVKIHFTD